MVECNLAKVEVAGSNPVSRSIISQPESQDAAKATVRTFVLTFSEHADSPTFPVSRVCATHQTTFLRRFASAKLQ